jgi:hypothetical protein
MDPYQIEYLIAISELTRNRTVDLKDCKPAPYQLGHADSLQSEPLLFACYSFWYISFYISNN